MSAADERFNVPSGFRDVFYEDRETRLRQLREQQERRFQVDSLRHAFSWGRTNASAAHYLRLILCPRWLRAELGDELVTDLSVAADDLELDEPGARQVAQQLVAQAIEIWTRGMDPADRARLDEPAGAIGVSPPPPAPGWAEHEWRQLSDIGQLAASSVEPIEGPSTETLGLRPHWVTILRRHNAIRTIPELAAIPDEKLESLYMIGPLAAAEISRALWYGGWRGQLPLPLPLEEVAG